MDNPCFCIPLRKGVLWIAILDIIIGAIGAGLAISAVFIMALAVTNNASPHEDEELIKNITATIDTTIPPLVVAEDEGHNTQILHDEAISATTSERPSRTILFTLFTVFLFYSLILIIFGVVLIYALAKDHLRLLKIWIGFRISGALFTLGTFIAFLVHREKATMQPTIFDGVSFVFSVYCIYVVYVLAVEVKHKQSGPMGGIKPFGAGVTGSGSRGTDQQA